MSAVTDAIRIGTTNSVAVFNNNTVGIAYCDPKNLNTTFNYHGNTPLSTNLGMPYKDNQTLMVSVNASGQLELSKYTYS